MRVRYRILTQDDSLSFPSLTFSGNYSLREFAAFHDCFGQIIADCPDTIDSLAPEWMTSYEVFNCACHEQEPQKQSSIILTCCDVTIQLDDHCVYFFLLECVDSLKCLIDESTSQFATHCANRYMYDVTQGTHNKC